MAVIDYYFGTVSPYVYLAGTRAEAIAAKHGLALRYRPVDLMALFSRTGGLPLGQRHETRRAYRDQELARQAKKAGLVLNLHPMFWPVNGAPSAYAVISAQTAAGRGEGGDLGTLVHAITRACWAEQRNIAEDDVIRDCLAIAGFDPELADRGMLTAAETYAANLEEAVSRGVFGSPFYITEGDQRFWGQDRLDDLDAHLSGKL